jgi:hypothetical protein
MAQRKSWASYAIWGSFAVCAVLAAAFTIAIVVGAHRGIQFAGLPKRTAAPPSLERPQTIITAPAVGEREFARVHDALRDLAAERDRLVVRLDQLERTVGDITASIRDRTDSIPPPAPSPLGRAAPDTAAQNSESARAAERVTAVQPPASQAPGAAPTGSVNPAIKATPPLSDPMDIFRPYVGMQPPIPPPAPTPTPTTAQTSTPAQTPMQIHAPAKTTDTAQPAGATRTEFAIDLGTEPTMDGLRARWVNLRGSHGTSLDGLRPLVSIREGARSGAMELRLVAGPLANAGAAARTCAALQAKGVNCQTTVFDGQRLALR